MSQKNQPERSSETTSESVSESTPEKAGRFGDFGGAYVPQTLVPALRELDAAYAAAVVDPAFQEDLKELLANYAGRPTPLYECRNVLKELGVTSGKLLLKREDLLHGGAHKTTQVLGQGLLARRMGKKRIIAETGAGQHGVATAMVGALLGFETCVYMGAVDVERQKPNVERMRLLGAEVIAIEPGRGTLKEAINEALRDWAGSFHNTHYLLGTAAGPHPYPSMVASFARIIGDEARRQCLEQYGRLPDLVSACVGGGSNAIGLFRAFLDDKDVDIVGVEADGHGLHSGAHGATLQKGTLGVLHGSHTLVLSDEHGQVKDAHSISAGLDYPAVGPEHVHLQTTGRVKYYGATDDDALDAFQLLTRCEGIIPALESSHVLAFIFKALQGEGQVGKLLKSTKDPVVVVNLSGRGDKDLAYVLSELETRTANKSDESNS
ncbi:MAG: tryptophan synthase subunit beta [Deltaproteobacteria bacterium]|nr:tryptophan synthase subunit beta [Deltaproteobacteria bacterium]